MNSDPISSSSATNVFCRREFFRRLAAGVAIAAAMSPPAVALGSSNAPAQNFAEPAGIDDPTYYADPGWSG